MAGHLLSNHRQAQDSKISHFGAYNRGRARAENWEKEYKYSCIKKLTDVNPSSSIAEADIIITCIGNDDDLKSLTIADDTKDIGNGIALFQKMKPGSILIDHSTVSPSVSIEISKIGKEKRHYFFRCPNIWWNRGGTQGHFVDYGRR